MAANVRWKFLSIINEQLFKKNKMLAIQGLENQILEQAILAVEQETGIRLEIDQVEVKLKGEQVDAILTIPGHKVAIAAEIKKWTQQANLGALIHQVSQLPLTGMLVADYINPNMADKLKAENVMFIDTTGNAYINLPPLYVFIKGNKTKLDQVGKKEAANRAFEPTGLKVIFAFLCDPDLLSAPYRAIAAKADVALGTVGWALNGLKDAGFVVARNQKDRRLKNHRKLLDRWVEAYPEKLKPKLFVGEFIADDPYWWKAIDIAKYGAYWGGEVAAAKYTNFLKPQIATIYLPEGAGNKLLANAKLRKAVATQAYEPGAVKIYRPFWPTPTINKRDKNKATPLTGVVHPILVYADLIATGDSRNIETARMIYDKYIVEHIRED